MGDQRFHLRGASVYVYLPVLLLLLTTVAVSMVKEVPIDQFMRDPTAVFNAPFYTGAISNIGILLWCATASICFLTFVVLLRDSVTSRERLFFFGASLLTTVLMIDDLFLVHESVAPRYFGLSAELVIVIYGALATAFFIHHRHFILKSDYVLLLVSMAFLALSVGLDVVADNVDGSALLGGLAEDDLQPSSISRGTLSFPPPSTHLFFEDAFKLLGIAGWLSYFGGECIKILADRNGREHTIT